MNQEKRHDFDNTTYTSKTSKKEAKNWAAGFSSIPFIITTNLVIFIAWNAPDLVSGIRFMVENFLVSWTALESGRYWTLITSVFSHNVFWHFFINMYVLHSFGRVMEHTLGKSRFIIFYFTAGIVASLSHSIVSAFLLNRPELPALGASGGVAGIFLVYALMFPKDKILLLAIIPMPAIVGALAFVGLDIWGLLSQAKGGGLPIGHGAHLGGALTGLLFYFLFIRPKMKQQRQHLFL